MISIVIPVYNRADLLRKAAESVFFQQYRPLELVVVDDGSTDHIDSVLADLKSRAATAGVQLKVLRNAENRGCGFSLHRGFRAAEGVFICYLGSDDLYVDHLKTSKQVAKMVSSRAEWSYFTDSLVGTDNASGGCTIEHIHPTYLPRMPFLNPLFERVSRLRLFILFWRNPINSSSLMIRASTYRAYGGWRSWTKNADCDGALVLYYSYLRLKCAALRGCPVLYRKHEGQAIQTPAYRKDFQETRERIFKFLASEGMSKPALKAGRFLTWLR